MVYVEFSMLSIKGVKRRRYRTLSIFILLLLHAAAGNYILTLVVATNLVTAQVVDTVTLQPVLPASGLSACPGQDVHQLHYC